MNKELAKIKEIYESGQNIIEYLRKQENRKINSFEDIMISYDFQAGTYADNYYKHQNDGLWVRYYDEIVKILNKYWPDGNNEAVLFEAGCGEATTLASVCDRLDKKAMKNVYGLDASFSRLLSAKSFLGERKFHLIMGNMLSMPVCDESCDMVFTVHACEPNGGNEEILLDELYRITKSYLILFEPAYDLAERKAQERMQRHGYVTRLYDIICEKGWDVAEHHLLGVSLNELNPTGVTVIKKNERTDVRKESVLADPVTKRPVVQSGNALWCRESMLLYPVINDIYCLCENNAIIATKYEEYNELANI